MGQARVATVATTRYNRHLLAVIRIDPAGKQRRSPRGRNPHHNSATPIISEGPVVIFPIGISKSKPPKKDWASVITLDGGSYNADGRDLSVKCWRPVCVCPPNEEAPMQAIQRLIRCFPFATLQQIEKTTDAFNKIEEAKFQLMHHRNLEENKAYELLREAAMRHRVDVATIARIHLEALETHD